MIEEQKSKLRIRKLTPKECVRLMGFDDEDYEAMAAVNSDSQIYKQCGNSICVSVLSAIFGEMLDFKTNSNNESNEIMPKLMGGVGEMTSNGGTQYYQQNRIYVSNSIALCLTAHESFNPYYFIEEEGGEEKE